ncbi:MAG: Calx-beta domain-containing protein [Planctomycetota bacterium]
MLIQLMAVIIMPVRSQHRGEPWEKLLSPPPMVTNFEFRGASDFPEYTGSMTDPLPADTQFVTFKADTGHQPVFTGISLASSIKENYTPYIFDGIRIEGPVSLSHVIGIRIRNCTIVRTTPDSGRGIHIAGKNINNDIRIENCVIHTMHQGIVTYCNNLAITGNDIYNVGSEQLQIDSGINILIENNLLHDTNESPGAHADGIAIGGTITNLTIRGNQIYNTSSQSIFCHGSTGMSYTNLLIENNLIYSNWSYELQLNLAHDVTIRNNTIIGNWGTANAFKVNGTCTNVHVYNNIFACNYWSSITLGNHDNNIYVYDAGSPGNEEAGSYSYASVAEAMADLFTNAANNDFSLKDNSRAIGFGTSVWGIPATDIIGTLRNDGDVDAGCYEHSEGGGSGSVVSIGDARVTEGDSGTRNINFAIMLSASSEQIVTVDYNTTDGTATTEDSDYSNQSGTATFSAGTTQQTISVLVNGDTGYEPDEYFVVILSSPTNATISDNQGIGTIENDDIPSLGDGLAGYWKFDEAGGSTALDSSGMSSDGTLVNGPAWTAGKIGSLIEQQCGYTGIIELFVEAGAV